MLTGAAVARSCDLRVAESCDPPCNLRSDPRRLADGSRAIPIWDIEFLVILGQAEPTPVGAKLRWSAQLCKPTASMPCRPATEHFEPQRCNQQTIKAFRHDISVVVYQLGCSNRVRSLQMRQYLAQLPPLARAYSCTPSRISPLKFAQICAH